MNGNGGKLVHCDSENYVADDCLVGLEHHVQRIRTETDRPDGHELRSMGNAREAKTP